ncbi:MAG: hypothetical protein H0U49_13020, partial [Parachlamydiaceae bacterium]|nr:hypothetical protein [Parachlamydiaceae bacterium]
MTTLKTIVLPEEIWTARAKIHHALVGPMCDAFISRRAIGLTHPVHDFLFTYYNCSPQKLKQWIPSLDERLETSQDIAEEYPYLSGYWFYSHANSLSVNKDRILEKTRQQATFVADLCSNILQRTPRYHCFGMHEWAMVYKLSPEDIRHKGHRLRLKPEDL